MQNRNLVFWESENLVKDLIDHYRSIRKSTIDWQHLGRITMETNMRMNKTKSMTIFTENNYKIRLLQTPWNSSKELCLVVKTSQTNKVIDKVITSSGHDRLGI